MFNLKNIAPHIVRDEISRAALDQDLPLVHDDEPVAEPFRLLEIMGGEHDRITGSLQGFEFLPDQVTPLRVKAYRRFIEDEELRIVDKGSCEEKPSLHASGEFLYPDIPFLFELEKREEFVRAVACLFFRQSRNTVHNW